MMKTLILTGILASAAISAQASDFYVLGDVGQSSFKLNEVDNKSATLIDVGTGYSLKENLSFELAYRDLGSVSNQGSGFNFDADVSAWQLSAVVKVPVSDSFYAFGRWGAGRIEVDATLPPSVSRKERTTRALYSIGVGYQLFDALGLRVEYLQYAKWNYTYVNNITVSTIAAGATYSF